VISSFLAIRRRHHVCDVDDIVNRNSTRSFFLFFSLFLMVWRYLGAPAVFDGA
jgi:hypothetical protein